MHSGGQFVTGDARVEVRLAGPLPLVQGGHGLIARAPVFIDTADGPIDEAFEKWRGRKSKVQAVNSLAFCAQAVLTHAQIMAGTAPPSAAKSPPPPFELDELRSYLLMNADALRRRPESVFQEIAGTLERLAADAEAHYRKLEDLERRLAALEDKMVAAARTVQSEEDLLAARREFDLQLRPYRSKMTADQIAMLEKQFLDRRLLEGMGLPRLSLFFLR